MYQYYYDTHHHRRRRHGHHGHGHHGLIVSTLILFFAPICINKSRPF